MFNPNGEIYVVIPTTRNRAPYTPATVSLRRNFLGIPYIDRIFFLLPLRISVRSRRPIAYLYEMIILDKTYFFLFDKFFRRTGRPYNRHVADLTPKTRTRAPIEDLLKSNTT
jgi:hypothetical protein